MTSLEHLPDDFLRGVARLLVALDPLCRRYFPYKGPPRHRLYGSSQAPCYLPIVATFSCCRRLSAVSSVPVAVEDIKLQDLGHLLSSRFEPALATFRRFAEMTDSGLALLLSCCVGALTDLDLSYSSGVSEIKCLGHCVKLRRLQLANTNVHGQLASLAGCSALEHLDLTGCVNITDISGLSQCTTLQWLSLLRCSKLRDISPLETCTALTELDLGELPLQSLTPVGQLTRLQTIELSEMAYLEDISALASCTYLTHVDLSCCGFVKDIEALQWCQKLHTVNLNHSNVMDASPLLKCAALRRVKVNYELSLDVTRMLTDKGVEIENDGSLEDWGVAGDSSEEFEP